MSKPIPISEIFGPVVQGEGPQAGVLTVFVRTGGCDYRCSWCDSMYAVDPALSKTWTRMTADEVVAAVVACSPTACWVTLSGGNPAMHDGLGEAITTLQGLGYQVAIETQGTVMPKWAHKLNLIVLSPKPPSSGQPFNAAVASQLENWLKLDGLDRPAVLKVVVDLRSDLAFLLQLATDDPWRRFPLYAQPCNLTPETGDTTPATHLWRYRELVQAVLDHKLLRVRVLPQLHVIAYGEGRGI